MPSKSIRDIRRADLMEAAYLTMQEHGLSGITTARVAERAGLSNGLVHHYFKDKSELIESAIRFSTAEQRNDVLACVARSSTPAERIWAIIEGNFSERGYTRPIAQGWVSFCGDACFNPRFLRIQKIVHRRMDDNLLFSLRSILPDAQARQVALDISVMIDGFWLRFALQGTPSRDEALTRMRSYLEPVLAQCEAARATARRARTNRTDGPLRATSA
jgi:TetR/AcrR family transcriptional repressor of bet genes